MPEETSSRWKAIPLWMWLVPFLLFAAVLGIIGLDADILWWDENYMLGDARVGKDLPLLVYHLSLTNPWHVPGYFILLNLWGRVMEWTWHPIVFRLPALYLGLLGVAFTYRLGRDHITPRVGLFAAIILSVSGFFIYFLHEARMYSSTLMLCAFVLWLYLRIVDSRYRAGWRSYLGLLLGFIAALYTHYFMLTFLAGLGVYHLLFAEKNQRWWRVTFVGALAVASFIPWVFTLLRVLERMSDTEMSNTLAPLPLLATLGTEFSNGVLLGLVIFALLSLPALRRLQGRARFAYASIWFSLVMALLIVIIGNELLEVVPVSRMRYLVLLWPLLSVVVAVGMLQADALLPVRHLSLGLLALWVGIAAWYTLSGRVNETLPADGMPYPMHTVSRELHDLHQPGDFVMHIIPPEAFYAWYPNVINLYNEFERLAVNPVALDLRGITSANMDAALQETVQGYNIGTGRDYIWVAYLPQNQEVVEHLTPIIEETTAYTTCGQQGERDGAIIEQFARHPVCCYGTAEAPLLNFSAASIADAASSVDDDQLSLWIASRTQPALPADTYSIGMYLINQEGTVAAQTDTGLPDERFACENHSIDISQLSNGEYGIYTAVYEWQTGQRLVAEDGANIVQIGTLQIDDAGRFVRD